MRHLGMLGLVYKPGPNHGPNAAISYGVKGHGIDF